MEHEVLFSTISLTGIALAGFSGVAVPLVNEGRPLGVRQRERFDILMISSLGATGLGLVPMCLAAYGVGESFLWRFSSTLLAVCLFLVLWDLSRNVFRRYRKSGSLVSQFRGRFVHVEIGNLILQFSAALGFGESAGRFALGTILLLVHGGLQFREIVFHPSGGEN